MTDINTYLESLKTKLEEVIVDFQSKYNTLPQGEVQLLANINAILNPGGSSGGDGDATNAGIKTAIETAENLGEMATVLGDIRSTEEAVGIIIQSLSNKIGLTNDSIAGSATANASLFSLIKFFNNTIASIQGVQLGVSSDTFPTSDAQISTLLAGLRRIAAKLPDNTGASTASVVTLGTSSSTLITANPARKKLVITNPISNVNTVFIDFSPSASFSVTNYAFPIAPGDSFVDETSPFVGTILGLASGTGTDISVREFT
jgi:hypothetical protein